jgi:hypothetical protein
MKQVSSLVLLLVVLGACHGRTQYHLTPNTPAAQTPSTQQPPTRRQRPNRRVRGGNVWLSDRDLAPLDSFIHARNAQWIIGDVVNVTASREYFAQNLTINATLGTVRRRDTTSAQATVVELDYLGAEGTASITTSPRILIGTGLTIMARKRLVLRLVKTEDVNRPVSLRVVAQGEASRGRKKEVLQRGPMLSLGGDIRRSGRRYAWFPIG